MCSHLKDDDSFSCLLGQLDKNNRFWFKNINGRKSNTSLISSLNLLGQCTFFKIQSAAFLYLASKTQKSLSRKIDIDTGQNFQEMCCDIYNWLFLIFKNYRIHIDEIVIYKKKLPPKYMIWRNARKFNRMWSKIINNSRSMLETQVFNFYGIWYKVLFV